MNMQVFKTVRLVVFGVVLGFALIILGIGANFVAQTNKYRGFTLASIPAFAVATAVLTFAILIPVIVIEFLRKGAMTSLAATELGFVGFLWILWLACASNSAAIPFTAFGTSDCSFYYDATAISLCHQFRALQAFSWLGWLVLFPYWIALLVIALISQSRGVNNAFMMPTTELAANMPAASASGEPKIPPSGYPASNYAPGSITPGSYPPQGQQYPQQGYTPSPMPSQPAPFQQPAYTGSPTPPPPGAIHV